MLLLLFQLKGDKDAPEHHFRMVGIKTRVCHLNYTWIMACLFVLGNSTDNAYLYAHAKSYVLEHRLAITKLGLDPSKVPNAFCFFADSFRLRLNILDARSGLWYLYGVPFAKSGYFKRYASGVYSCRSSTADYESLTACNSCGQLLKGKASARSFRRHKDVYCPALKKNRNPLGVEGPKLVFRAKRVKVAKLKGMKNISELLGDCGLKVHPKRFASHPNLGFFGEFCLLLLACVCCFRKGKAAFTNFRHRDVQY